MRRSRRASDDWTGLRHLTSEQLQALQALLETARAQGRAHRTWLYSKTFEADVMLLVTADSEGLSKTQQWEVACRLATHFSPSFRDPAAQRCVRERIRDSGRPDTRRWLLEEVFPPAVMLVFAELHQPRYIRLGAKWAHGRRIPGEPEDVLTESTFRRWFRQEVRNAAEAVLLDDRDYPPALTDPTSPLEVPAPPEAWRRALSRHLQGCSPRQQELLRHLEAGVPRRALHRVLGVTPSTVRVMLHRIRRRQPR